ncbi:MAG TPA: heme-binding protein [Gemmatimonadaceae bacterium]|nr:heme-binding protein [Gemmatimonadaceae bacterium]
MRTHRTERGASWAAALICGLGLVAASACSDSLTTSQQSNQENGNQVSGLPDWQTLRAALIEVRQEENGGLGFDMWATVVDRTGTVVAVVFTGDNLGDQWPASRVISAQKANTANSLSLPDFALSTANLYSATQPGGSLFGLQFSNPVDPAVAYCGNTGGYGTQHDCMVGNKIGGINVFGGGLALYGPNGTLLGAIGVSGDLSCADHNIAWKVRDRLSLDFVPAGVADDGADDNIIFDITNDTSASGFGHPVCNEDTRSIGEQLPETNPIGGGEG